MTAFLFTSRNRITGRDTATPPPDNDITDKPGYDIGSAGKASPAGHNDTPSIIAATGQIAYQYSQIRHRHFDHWPVSSYRLPALRLPLRMADFISQMSFLITTVIEIESVSQ